MGALFSGETDGQIQRIEIALRRTDNFGRVLTAKQAFRELCYHFHGKHPSKNRENKRSRQYIMDLASKKNLTTTNSRKLIDKTLEIRQKNQSPYLKVESNFKSR